MLMFFRVSVTSGGISVRIDFMVIQALQPRIITELTM